MSFQDKTGNPKLTQADLGQLVTLGEVMEIMQEATEGIVEEVEMLLEHWTDSDGVHAGQFTKELRAELPKDIERYVTQKLLERI